jgi:hypothetical protein
MIQFQFFPRSQGLDERMTKIVEAFQSVDKIRHTQVCSNVMLEMVRPYLEELGFRVERGKQKEEKIDVPVLYGENNKVDKFFSADALSNDGKVVLEVEAGRAVMNNQFLKDIFQACMMFNVEYLVLAVQNEYHTRMNGKQMNWRDYEKIKIFLETMYVSNRLRLPLSGILLIGY